MLIRFWPGLLLALCVTLTAHADERPTGARISHYPNVLPTQETSTPAPTRAESRVIHARSEPNTPVLPPAGSMAASFGPDMPTLDDILGGLPAPDQKLLADPKLRAQVRYWCVAETDVLDPVRSHALIGPGRHRMVRWRCTVTYPRPLTVNGETYSRWHTEVLHVQRCYLHHATPDEARACENGPKP